MTYEMAEQWVACGRAVLVSKDDQTIVVMTTGQPLPPDTTPSINRFTCNRTPVAQPT